MNEGVDPTNLMADFLKSSMGEKKNIKPWLHHNKLSYEGDAACTNILIPMDRIHKQPTGMFAIQILESKKKKERKKHTGL